MDFRNNIVEGVSLNMVKVVMLTTDDDPFFLINKNATDDNSYFSLVINDR
jgi:hypothetical protein